MDLTWHSCGFFSSFFTFRSVSDFERYDDCCISEEEYHENSSGLLKIKPRRLFRRRNRDRGRPVRAEGSRGLPPRVREVPSGKREACGVRMLAQWVWIKGGTIARMLDESGRPTA